MIESVEEFIRLRRSEDPAEYLRAAHDEAPLAVWLDLIAHHPGMRSWAAHNKTVPIDVLSILACDPDSDVRFSVAMKNKLTPALMHQLASDPDASVRTRIAYNKNAPIELLRLLATGTDPNTAAAAQVRLTALAIEPDR